MSRIKPAIILKDPDGSTVFICGECPMSYKDVERLELHMCMHNNEYRFICTICGTGLKRKEHLDRHKLEHQEYRPHSCEDCGKAFKRKEHLNIHRAIHSTERTQDCPLCERSFHRKDHLQKHLQTHNKQILGNATFPITGSELEIKIECDDTMMEPLVQDFADSHDSQDMPADQPMMLYNPDLDPQRPHTCGVCAKTFKRKDHLKLHCTNVHMKKDKRCSECGTAFHKQEQLLAHMAFHIKSESLLEGSDDELPRLLIAEDQGQAWQPTQSSESSLLVPRLPIHPSVREYRPHECPICHKRFKRKQHLKVHSNVHNKEHTIWCSVCNEGFRANEEFESHECMMQNTEGDSENFDETQVFHPMVSMVESEEGDADAQEVQHVNIPVTRALEQHIPVPRRVFVCKYCAKHFRRKDHYKIHLNIHTGIKSFFCPDCGKGFYRKDHLQKHIPTHYRQKPAPKTKKQLPPLYPISMFPNKSSVLPEITIHAPSSAKMRLPLQMKVPYQMVVSSDDGHSQAVIVDPQQPDSQHEIIA